MAKTVRITKTVEFGSSISNSDTIALTVASPGTIDTPSVTVQDIEDGDLDVIVSDDVTQITATFSSGTCTGESTTINITDNTVSPTPSISITPSASSIPPTPSNSPEPTPSNSPEPTPSNSPEASPGVTPSNSPEPTPSNSPEPTPSNSPEPTPSNSPEPTPSNSPEPTPSNSPEPTPSNSPAASPSTNCYEYEVTNPQGFDIDYQYTDCDGIVQGPFNLTAYSTTNAFCARENTVYSAQGLVTLLDTNCAIVPDSPTPSPTRTPSVTPTPSTSTTFYSFTTVFSSNSELEACGQVSPTATVYSTCSTITTGCILLDSQNIFDYAADGWYHDINNGNYYNVEGNGYVTETGVCSAPSPTPTPSPSTAACTAVLLQEFGSATSSAACSGASATDTRGHNGSGTYPEIGDTIYARDTCAATFNGGNLWYFVGGDTSAIFINTSGTVVNKVNC